MKKLLISLLLLLPLAAWAQDITGTWSGKAKIGPTELRIVFHFTADAEAGYSGTMDSPDQGAKGIQLTSVEFDGETVKAVISQLAFTYTGTLDGGDRLKGAFTQGPATFDLDLIRGEEVVNRPQEPEPPYPYHSEEVRFDNPQAGITLAGTLTYPLTEGIFPAVIMVTGSGPQNRDEELFGHKPFLVIADHLTRNGIAVLRYDDRGTAGSSGSFAGSTAGDFTGDALAAFDYLRTRGEINPSQIGIIGHSEGGTIAFMAAARQPEVGFIVSLAGSMLRGDSLLVLQNRDIMRLKDVGVMTIENYSVALGAMYRIKIAEEQDFIDANIDNITATLPGYADLEAGWQSNLVHILKDREPWFNYMIRHDPAGDIKRTDCPVFAINGEKDCQVSAEHNIGHFTKIMQERGKTDYATRIYPGLNHLLQQCTTGNVTEYGQIEQTISPVVLHDMASWILEITK